mgnify:CR=1 FL=1
MGDTIVAQRLFLTGSHWMAVGGVFAAVCMLATGGIFVKYSALDPIATGVWRVLFAIPLAWGWLLSERRSAKATASHSSQSWRDTALLVIAGMSLGCDLALWNISFSYTTVANANLLANMVPFIIIPVAWLFFKESISAKFLGGAVLTIAGLALLLGRKFSTGLETLLGDGLALATAIFYAIYLLMVRRLRERYSTSYIMYMSGFGCLVVLIPLSLAIEDHIFPQVVDDLWPLLGLAAIAHVGGQGLLALSMKYLSASLSSVLVLLQPAVAAFYAWHLFGEQLAVSEVSGITVCIAGLYVATRSKQTGS